MQAATLMETIKSVIKSARTGDYGNTAAQFNIALQLMHQFMSSGSITKETIKKLTYSMETLLAMQQMENWVAFADVLEFEIIPLWKTIRI